MSQCEFAKKLGTVDKPYLYSLTQDYEPLNKENYSPGNRKLECFLANRWGDVGKYERLPESSPQSFPKVAKGRLSQICLGLLRQRLQILQCMFMPGNRRIRHFEPE